MSRGGAGQRQAKDFGGGELLGLLASFGFQRRAGLEPNAPRRGTRRRLAGRGKPSIRAVSSKILRLALVPALQQPVRAGPSARGPTRLRPAGGAGPIAFGLWPDRSSAAAASSFGTVGDRRPWRRPIARSISLGGLLVVRPAASACSCSSRRASRSISSCKALLIAGELVELWLAPRRCDRRPVFSAPSTAAHARSWWAARRAANCSSAWRSFATSRSSTFSRRPVKISSISARSLADLAFGPGRLAKLIALESFAGGTHPADGPLLLGPAGPRRPDASAGRRIVLVELAAGLIHRREQLVELAAELGLPVGQFFQIGLLLRLEIFPLLAQQSGPSCLVACSSSASSWSSWATSRAKRR